MSDLVERLRKWSTPIPGIDESMTGDMMLMADAANEIQRLRTNEASFRRHTLKTERWRGALMNIAQGKGDPVSVACAALELDND